MEKSFGRDKRISKYPIRWATTIRKSKYSNLEAHITFGDHHAITSIMIPALKHFFLAACMALLSSMTAAMTNDVDSQINLDANISLR